MEHRNAADGAIVAQNPETVEFRLERDVLGAAAGGVEDLHSYDRGDPQAIVDDRLLDEFAGERREPPPRRRVDDERRVATQQLGSVHRSR
jgi:hypothetical protein